MAEYTLNELMDMHLLYGDTFMYGYIFIYIPGRVRPPGLLFPSTRDKNVKIHVHINLKL